MHCRVILAAFLGFTALSAIGAAERTTPAPRTVKHRISGPYVHANLSLFLIHGKDELPGRTFVTLKEALERKLVVVHETSNVNQLSVENTSTTVEVFIMAGDVVKGGKQDRAIAFDMILPPSSGKMALASFCVESGRWRKRGNENDGCFACPDTQVVGRALKNAVNRESNQQEVWKEVAEAQKKLSDNVGKPVQNAASPTSLQLSLEGKDVQEKIAKYETPLAGIIKDHNDVIGVVAVVNDEISGADAFGSSELFRMLWPKLLKSACTEALCEFKADKKFEAVKADEVVAFLSDAAKGEAKEVGVTVAAENEGQRGRNLAANDAAQSSANRAPAQPPASVLAASKVRVLKYTNAKSLLLECCEKDKPTNVVHRAYIAK